MNKVWSEKNKEMQRLLKKATFPEGIAQLLELREMLMQTILSWRTERKPQDFCIMPFPNAQGYHSKTAAYSLWHIFRIEDIVVNTLIRNQEEMIFAGGFAQRMHSPILTTGNELVGEEITAFSKELDIGELYAYMLSVRKSTDEWLQTLEYADLKKRFSETDKGRIRSLNVVSEDESAAWLIEYWCGKDVKGLIQMPMSRHWIMHIEASVRILEGIHAI